ncbi:MAG TPA: aminotransferase class V-fold PLP-dependent enzyme [Candidatus Tumulicola sp.]|nr:aminotransferase class V-fold PLP-dependent enzyme [Candidatus Tumulicola sp.]
MEESLKVDRPPALAPPLDRSLFPIAEQWAYCDHASVGPLPRPTFEAVAAMLDAQMRQGKTGVQKIEQRRDEVRRQVAKAINADPSEIAFMRNTSDGALVAANGIDWRPGDEIIMPDDEFGANAYPWLNLRERGVSIRLARSPRERLTVETLERLASSRTRLVAVSQVGFSDGYRNDIAAIGRWCNERGVYFALDAMQGFGHLPLDVRACGADFAYFAAGKWLLSPQGFSVVFVRRSLIEKLRPALASWRSVRDPMNFLDYDQPLKDSAERFDGGTLNYPGMLGFSVSLGLLTATGLENIERHVLALIDSLIEQAQARGIDVKSSRAPGTRSGIVLFGLGGRDPDKLNNAAQLAKVGLTARPVGVRISPHGYNDESDIARVMAVLT